MYTQKYVFDCILSQIGGAENLTAVGVEADSIRPVTEYRHDYGGYEIHGLVFTTMDGKEVKILLELSDTYTLYVNGKEVKDYLYFFDLCSEVEQAIGARMPYYVLAKLEEQEQDDTFVFTTSWVRCQNPFFVG